MTLVLESRKMTAFRPSATVRMAQLARTMRGKGKDIISLASGESDFDTPVHVRDAAKEAIDIGHTRYTAVDGIPELKEAICRKFKRENGLTFTPSQINVSPGGKAVIFNALCATLDNDDEVIVPAPYWVSYPDMVLLAGGRPVVVPTLETNGFKLVPAQLEAAIGARTRWLILNSPSNPTGATYSWVELAALADVLLRHPHVMVLCDDIYEHLIFDDRAFATLAEVEPWLAERVLTVNGVSKSHAMTGWRIGFAGGPERLVSMMAKVMGQTTSNPCSISQWAALAALDGPGDFLDESRHIFEGRRDLVVRMLNEASGLHCGRPDGAFYAFASCAGQIGRISPGGVVMQSDEDFALELLSATGVALVHGSAFGMSPYVRLSFAAATSELDEACLRIQRFCAATRPI